MRRWGIAAFVAVIVALSLAPGTGQAQEGAASEIRLTAEEARQVDTIIGKYVEETQARIVAECHLGDSIEQLRAGPKGYGAWHPAAGVGWCVKKCRDALVPIPTGIDNEVVDAIAAIDSEASGMDDRDRKQTRDEVARALGFIGNKRGLPTVLHILETGGGHYAWQGLPDIADPAMIPVIERKLDFTDYQDAEPAIQALERMGPVAIPLLNRFIQGGDRAPRRTAVEALLAIQSVECLPVLDGLTNDPSQEIRDKAGIYARIIRSREIDRVYVPPKLEAETVRRLACLARMAHQAPRRFDPRVRRMLVSLGPKAVPTVRELLRSSSHGDGVYGPVYEMTEWAAGVMVSIGRPAIPALIDALNDEQEHVHAHAAGALTQLTGQSFGESYEAWRDWWKAGAPGMQPQTPAEGGR